MNSKPSSPKTVVVMGAESTGKTTLASALAKHYQTVWAEEYLRKFVDEKGTLPEEADVHAIAQGHLDLVSRMLDMAYRVLFVDTDLFTTCVYQRIYFGKCPKYIEKAAIHHQSGLYLFMEPDIPWVADPGQRAGPQERLYSHKLLNAEAKAHSLNIVPICGTHNERVETAIEVVDDYLRSGMSFTKRNPT